MRWPACDGMTGCSLLSGRSGRDGALHRRDPAPGPALAAPFGFAHAPVASGAPRQTVGAVAAVELVVTAASAKPVIPPEARERVGTPPTNDQVPRVLESWGTELAAVEPVSPRAPPEHIPADPPP